MFNKVSDSIYLKRGAMFGLDARIALAIFGALSVISGAALYSAIQAAKSTALLADMNEVGKAWEQYYLDTGQDLPKNGSTGADLYILKLSNLVEDPGISGWNGPYLPYPKNGTSALLSKDNENIFILNITDEEVWGGATDWGPGFCTTGRKCFVWVRIDDFKTEDLAKGMDSRVDGGDGAEKGKVRWAKVGAVYYYYLQYAPVKNPND
jgi:type II secretory pathway pseudopilin PulG